MQTELKKTPALLRDALLTLLFSLLSAVLSKVQFHIPGIVDSDLREIPFLICLFYIRNPLFVFALVLSAFYGAPSDMPSWAIYIAHLVPLLAAFFSLKALERLSISGAAMGIIWVVITGAYYLFALLPLVIVAVSHTPSLTTDGDIEFWEAYRSSLPSFRFEMITSSLVTGLYLMQMKTRVKLKDTNLKLTATNKKLEDTNKNLEQMVALRTNELTHANNELLTVNEELKASNDGIKELNENLEQLVKDRTDKIRSQLEQLHRYAYMNSHELRAPLARILGLLQLFEYERVPEQTRMLLRYLQESSTELDDVIRQMNRLLEKEITVEEH